MSKREKPSEKAREKARSMPSPAGSVAGESVKDAGRWPGYALVAVGVAALAGSLTALATGHREAASICAVATIIAILSGTNWYVARHRRLQQRLSTGTPEPPEDGPPLG